MGSNKVEGDIVFAEVDFGGGGESINGFDQQHHQVHRKHRRKKPQEVIIETSSNSDADIVTPYQNGHYNNPNNYHNHRTRLPHRHSSFEEVDGNGEIVSGGGVDDDEEEDQLTQLKDYLSPTFQHLLIDDQRGVNNAITVAPSRTNLNDSNVFAGGRPSAINPPPSNKRHHRNNNRHHNNKHKGRSRTPDFTTHITNHRLRNGEDGSKDNSQSILNRIDLSIKKNFGAWDSDDEDDLTKKFRNGCGGDGRVSNGGKPQKIPYFIPKSVASDSDVGLMNGGDLNLPRLFKPYESEVNATRKVLNDKTYKVALSRDNEDPNSILSQAKKTLSFVSGQS